MVVGCPAAWPRALRGPRLPPSPLGREGVGALQEEVRHHRFETRGVGQAQIRERRHDLAVRNTNYSGRCKIIEQVSLGGGVYALEAWKHGRGVLSPHWRQWGPVQDLVSSYLP